MKEYLLSVLASALILSLVSILMPNNAQTSVKLISALFFLCVLIAPFPKWIRAIPDYIESLSSIQNQESTDDYHQQANELLNGASKTYVAQMLTEYLEQQFSIPSGEVRCLIQWDDGDAPRPTKITVILSGSAIWKDPAPIETAVVELLDCECVTAIE